MPALGAALRLARERARWTVTQAHVCGRSRHRGLLFFRLLEQALATDPHPYNVLRAQEAA